MLRARLCMGILALVLGVVWESGVMGRESRDACNCDCSCQPEITISEGCCGGASKKESTLPPTLPSTQPSTLPPTPATPTMMGTSTTPQPPPSTTTTPPCEVGWLPHEGRCYKFDECGDYCTWTEARTICQGLQPQADLMTVSSQSLQQFLASNTNGKIVYIGGSDADTDGDWKWTDGSEVAPAGGYNNWPSGIPPALAASDCMVVSSEGPRHWLGIECGEENETTMSYACDVGM